MPPVVALKSEPAADPLPEPRPCPTLARMLCLAGARPEHRICVTGPSSYAALLALCRLGFEHACRVCGPGCAVAEGACDIALITGPCEGAAFDALVAGVAGHVREGGVLVVHEAGLKDDERVRASLAACRREAGWCVHDLSHGCLVAFQVLGRLPTGAHAVHAA